MKANSCSKCNEVKDVSDFPRDKRSSSGLSSWCRKCHCEATKKWKAENKELYKKTRKTYEKSNHGRFKRAQVVAKRRNISWDLTFKDFEELISDECFYCEGSLGSNSTGGSGLDRVDSTKGYYYDNLVPCCGLCNKIKNNFLTLDETLVAVEAIIKLRRNIHG